MTSPLVSVVIPAWNCEDYISQTIDSVLCQTWPEVEIVVVDDGSTDGTSNILKKYGRQIHVTRIENSGGPSQPRNVGVAKSSGDFIALFDSDDLMEPVKLAASMGVFEAHPDVDFVFTAFQGIDPAGTVIKDNWLSDYRRFRDDLIPGQRPEIGILPGDKAYRQLLRANFIGTSSVVCRKKALIEAGPFDESLKNADDIDLWFRLAHHGCTFAFLDEVLHSYRVTKSGVTSRSWQRYPAVISVLKRQLQICDDPDDRSHLKNTLKTKFLGQAWGLRKQGDLKGAETAYRNSLELGFSWQGFLNLHKTQITRLIRNR